MTSSHDTNRFAPALSALPPLRRWVPFILLLAAALAAPETAVAAARFALESLIRIAPMLIAALLITAYATASGSIGLISGAFGGRQIRMILFASAIGAMTPVCGITLFPLIAGLLAARVPLAAIMAFWLSSPIAGPGMLVVTAATLGTSFAVAKFIASFGCGLVGGFVVLALTRAGYMANPQKTERPTMMGGCGCDAPTEVMWRFWRDAGRRRVFRTSIVSQTRLMLFWLSIAFVAEYFLRRYVPEDVVASLVGADSDYGVMLAATIGAPIYLDGYAALPLVRGLVETGMRPDAALAFLIAGGIVSLWGALPVYALVRLPIFLLYLGLAVFCSMLSGWAYGAYLALV